MGNIQVKYRNIIHKQIDKLKYNRFAVIVVSEIRNDRGAYKGLIPYTINCFTEKGMYYYNDMVLVNVAGTLPIRIASQFVYRKIGRMHQNILVFYKGDIDKIPKYYNKIEIGGNV